MIYSDILERIKSRKKHLKQIIKSLEKLPSKEVDHLFHQAHESAFNEIDCLKCANCCKSTGPLFTQKDIERISKYLRLSPQEFISQYLKIDEENDFILQVTPCKFLDESNYCTIYSIRPRACSEYPHTDQKGIKGIMTLTEKNSLICPAVAKMFDEIELKLQKK